MKLNVYFILLALSSMSLLSCDDDDKKSELPEALQQSFSKKFPTATLVEWEKKGAYYEADFIYNNTETSAWFALDGTWEMTESDILYSTLPAEVKTTFESSKYASWRVDDADQLERKDLETTYVLDVELGEQEMDLYYSKEGELIKAVVDTDSDDSHFPAQ